MAVGIARPVDVSALNKELRRDGTLKSPITKMSGSSQLRLPAASSACLSLTQSAIPCTRVISALHPQGKPGVIRLLDPCCGTGAALADIKQSLVYVQSYSAGQSLVETYGVEFDKERAWQAKDLLYRVLHADVHDTVIKARSVGLLFLNPPYGFGVSDNANLDRNNLDTHEKAERLERTFLKKTAPMLMPGGVLVYIVPFYAIDEEIRTYLARNFRQVHFFMAPEQAYKQCVIFGVKVKPGHPDK